MNSITKLPQNNKEFILFLSVISIISANVITPLITCLEIGFSLQNWVTVLKILPILWPVGYCGSSDNLQTVGMADIKVDQARRQLPGRNHNKYIMFRFLISILLTIIGTWIGTRSITITPIRNFIYIWPRNMTIAFNSLYQGFASGFVDF